MLLWVFSQFLYYTEVYHGFYRKTFAKFIYSKSAIDKVKFPFLFKNINETIPYDSYINDLKITCNFEANMKLLMQLYISIVILLFTIIINIRMKMIILIFNMKLQ